LEEKAELIKVRARATGKPLIRVALCGQRADVMLLQETL
jgi:hypothetical protein